MTCVGQTPSAIHSESIHPLSVLHSGLKREWYPIFSTFCGQKNSKKKQTFIKKDIM